MGVVLVSMDELKEHEEIDPVRVEEMKKQIQKDGMQKYPILVDRKTNVILDGHFRYNALKQMGCSKIAVYYVNYHSPKISVDVWRKGESVTKEDVIKAGLTGKKMPPKTSKHMYRLPDRKVHLSKITKKVDISLAQLRGSGLMVANDISELIGNTPMVRIHKLVGKSDATVLAKLEWYNIGGSIKDRMALYMLQGAEEEGKLKDGKVILEATSGNTGIAMAMIAAVKGLKIKIVMPESVSVERRQLIQAYGAELILSPGKEGTGGAVELKRKMMKEEPGKYVDIDQFRDPRNILAHYKTTGKEIIEQTGGRVDVIVLGIGTAGTGVGTSKRVKEFNPKIKVVGVMPKLGAKIQGLRNPAEQNPTQLYKRESFDEVVELGEEELPKTYRIAKRAAREEGLFMGMSAGAVLYVALKKAKELGAGKMVVAILPDGGNKYLSTGMFNGD